MYVSMPFTSACDRRSSTRAVAPLLGLFWLRAGGAAALAFSRSPKSTRRSVASGRRFEQHVLDQLVQLGLDLLVDLEHAGVDDAHVHAGARWRGSRNAECIASRTGLLPRKLNETLDTPPLTLACGRFCLIQRVAWMKSTA